MAKNAACPKESRAVYPSSKLKAHANNAKHNAFIRKTGYMTKGARTPAASNKANPTYLIALPLICVRSLLLAKQSHGTYQKHNRHDEEHHRAGRLRIKHLGETFNQPQSEAGDNRPQDGAHAANTL